MALAEAPLPKAPVCEQECDDCFIRKDFIQKAGSCALVKAIEQAFPPHQADRTLAILTQTGVFTIGSLAESQNIPCNKVQGEIAFRTLKKSALGVAVTSYRGARGRKMYQIDHVALSEVCVSLAEQPLVQSDEPEEPSNNPNENDEPKVDTKKKVKGELETFKDIQKDNELVDHIVMAMLSGNEIDEVLISMKLIQLGRVAVDAALSEAIKQLCDNPEYIAGGVVMAQRMTAISYRIRRVIR